MLDVAKRLKRRTHALLLSGPAQVVDVRSNVLILGFASGPVERQFNTGDNVDILQEALKEVLGVDWRIETTLSGPPPPRLQRLTPMLSPAAAPPPSPSESMAADRAPVALRSCSRGGGRAEEPRSPTRCRGGGTGRRSCSMRPTPTMTMRTTARPGWRCCSGTSVRPSSTTAKPRNAARHFDAQCGSVHAPRSGTSPSDALLCCRMRSRAGLLRMCGRAKRAT